MNQISKHDRFKVCFRHQYLQGSWNFERMQNGGWCYAILPALKALYKDEEDYHAAVERHLEFYNTHPYVSAPIIGIIMNMEERKANGEPITKEMIHDAKIGLMGPLAGVGDPVFWFTLRPILAALGASLALTGHIMGPILFFVLWNVIRFAFLWFTQERGYQKGLDFVNELSDGFLKKVSLAASMLGMFVIGILVQRWVLIDVANIQESIDMILPGAVGLGLFFIVRAILKKGTYPVLLIVILFVICIALSAMGVLVL